MTDSDSDGQVKTNGNLNNTTEQEVTDPYRLPSPDVRARTQRHGQVVPDDWPPDDAPRFYNGSIADPVMELGRQMRRSHVGSDGETQWTSASRHVTYGRENSAWRDGTEVDLQGPSAQRHHAESEPRGAVGGLPAYEDDKINQPVMRVGLIIMLILAMGYPFPLVDFALRKMGVVHHYPGSLDLVQYRPQDVLKVMWSLDEPEMEWDPDMIRPQGAVDGVEQNPAVFYRDDESGVEEESPPASLLEHAQVDVHCLTSSSSSDVDSSGNGSSSGYISGSSFGDGAQQVNGSSSSDGSVPVQLRADDQGSPDNCSGASMEAVAHSENGGGAMEADHDPGEKSPEVDSDDSGDNGNHGDNGVDSDGGSSTGGTSGYEGDYESN